MRSGNRRSGYKRRKEVIREALDKKRRCNKRREAVI